MKRHLEKVEPCSISRDALLEYWETSDAQQGGVIDRIDEQGLHIHSYVNMPVGRTLSMRIFFSLGHDFDGFEVTVRIVTKAPSCQEGCEAYDYELEFIVISDKARLKLGDLLRIRRLGKN